jgi:hypothetical protein
MIRLEFPRTLTFPPAKREFDVGDFLTFSNRWPENLGIKPGMTYQVVWHQEVPYELHYILPANDYKDVDISDPTSYTATGPENLYPYGANNTLYQILFGLKPGNFVVHLYMPANQYILGLEYTNMYPSQNVMTDPKLKYIGAIRWHDTPYYDPRLKLITVYNMLPFYFRFLVDLGDFEKCVAPLIINHCMLNPIANPTAEQKSKNLIRYVTEIAWRPQGAA